MTPILIYKLCLSLLCTLDNSAHSFFPSDLLSTQHPCYPVTALELRLWLAIQIHMGLIDVPPERYWMKDGVYLPKDGLPPAAYLSKTRFQEIRRFFHISPYDYPTESPEGLPCWHSKVDVLLEQVRFFSLQYRVPSRNVTIDEANKPISQGYKFFCLAEKG
jgi:hypothetical protein